MFRLFMCIVICSGIYELHYYNLNVHRWPYIILSHRQLDPLKNLFFSYSSAGVNFYEILNVTNCPSFHVLCDEGTENLANRNERFAACHIIVELNLISFLRTIVTCPRMFLHNNTKHRNSFTILRNGIVHNIVDRVLKLNGPKHWDRRD